MRKDDEAGTPDTDDASPDDEVRSEERKDRAFREFQKRLKQSMQHSEDWRTEARQLYDMRAGHQWDEEDLSLLRERYKGAYPAVTFNLSDKYMDVVGGLQINNRQQIKYFPREQGDAAVNEILTGAVEWNRDQCEAEDEETDAFGDAFLTGMGWMEHFVDEDDGETIIAQERRDPLEMFWDPSARKRNLADSRYVIRIRGFLPDEYEEKFGEEPPENLSGATFGTEEDSPQIINEPHDYGDNNDGANQPSRIYVADYQWYELEAVYDVVAQFPQGVQEQTFDKGEWPKIKGQLEEYGIPYQADERRERKYYRAWIAGSEIKKEIRDLPGKQFLHLAITGKRDRNHNTWYGMGRTIRDPQMWVNKFFSSILYALSTNAKGGLLAEEDAFTDQQKAEESWGDPSAITWTTEGAIANKRIMPKPQAPYPEGIDRLMQFSLEALPMTSGLNPEIMGLSGQNQPGVLEAQRKQSAMAIIAWIFDSMRRYYKQSGKLMATLIREYMPEGSLIRIVGDQGAQYVPLVKDQMTQKFDVIVDESPTSINMRERVWGILGQMIPMAVANGIRVPPEVLDYAPIPEELAQKWKQSLQPSPEQQQAQQKQEQMKEAAFQTDLKKNQASAQKDITAALLNQAKAQEIQQTTPIENELTKAETVKTASEAGRIQAGE